MTNDTGGKPGVTVESAKRGAEATGRFLRHRFPSVRALTFEESAASAEVQLVGPDFEGRPVRITGPNGEVFDGYLTLEPVPPNHDGVTFTYTVTPA